MTHAFLPDRAFLDVGGADAEPFLQNLITTDLSGLEAGEAAPGALLTPQGKILFFFLISRRDQGFSLETDSVSRDNLLKRLTMYRLRAAVDLTPSDAAGVTVAWDEPARGASDRRFAKAGIALFRAPGGMPSGGDDGEAYHALRVLHGIAESSADHADGDAFPHDILMDRSGGLSFRKGCYVGQEVVSRMQHRGTARRRLATVSADRALPPPGTPVTIDGKAAGTLGTVSGNRALALLRIDRVGEAIVEGRAVLAGDVPVSPSLPAWAELSFPPTASGDEA